MAFNIGCLFLSLLEMDARSCAVLLFPTTEDS